MIIFILDNCEDNNYKEAFSQKSKLEIQCLGNFEEMNENDVSSVILENNKESTIIVESYLVNYNLD